MTNDLFYLIVDLYVAPEVYKNVIFDRSVDAYSFGVMLYEVHGLSKVCYQLTQMLHSG